jgi:hypothetical protein
MQSHQTWVFKDEVEREHPVNDAARRRAERSGLFPPRTKLTSHICAWRRDGFEAWRSDPIAWSERRKSAAREVA